jgi:hypothetical protein
LIWSSPPESQASAIARKYPDVDAKGIRVGRSKPDWGGRPLKVIKTTIDAEPSMICSHGICLGNCYKINLCRYHFDLLDLLSRRIPKPNPPTLLDVLNSSLTFRRRLPPLIWGIVPDKEFELLYKLHGFGDTPAGDAVDFKIGSTPFGERRFLAIYRAHDILLEELCPEGGCTTVYDKNKDCRVHPVPKKKRENPPPPPSSSSSMVVPRLKKEDVALSAWDRLQTAIGKLSSRKNEQFEWRRSTASESDFFRRAFYTKAEIRTRNNEPEFFIVHNQEGAPSRRFVAILDDNNVNINELCTAGGCLKCSATRRLCREHFEKNL